MGIREISNCFRQARNLIARILGMPNLSPLLDSRRLNDLRSQLFIVEREVRLGRYAPSGEHSRVLEPLISQASNLFLKSLTQFSREPGSQSAAEEVLNSFGTLQSLINDGRMSVNSPLDDFVSGLEERYPALFLEVRRQSPYFPYDTVGVVTPKLMEIIANHIREHGRVSVREAAERFSIKPEELETITKELSHAGKLQTIRTRDGKFLLSWGWGTKKAAEHINHEKRVDITKIAKKLNIEEEDAGKLVQSTQIQKLDKIISQLETENQAG